MRIFKICKKCNTKYLLFHLESDCNFAIEKFKVIKSLFEEKTKKYEPKSFLEDMGLTGELDKESSFIEHSRCNSVPFLLISSSFIIGLLLGFFTQFDTISSVLVISALCLTLLYVVFLIQGGFNLLFKQIIMRDLLKRYHPKKNSL